MNSSLPATPASLPKTRFGRFFYNEEVPYGLALVRILLPISLLGAMLPRWPVARELYSTDGATTPLWVTYGYTDMLPEVSGTLAVALFTALIFFLITSTLGWCSRISLIASFFLYTYFNLMDAISTMTKYSVIASHGLLLLSLSQSGSVWSLDSWIHRKRNRNVWPGEPAFLREKFPVWPQRLMQLMIAFVYFGAAITKMKTPAFFSGDQLQTWMISNVNFANPLGEKLAMHPAVLIVFAYVTIVWEVTFIFLVWKKSSRLWMLGIGAMFHVGSVITLGLYIFPAVCISIYFVFLEEQDLQKLASFFRRLKRKCGFAGVRTTQPAAQPSSARHWGGIKAPAPAVMGVVLAVVIVSGVELEYRLDPYGIRRPQGPYELKELDAEYVTTKMLVPSPMIRPEDVISFFDTGSTLVGGMLVNKRREFQQGETVTVQCTLNPPHEDMWLECKLQDADGHLIDRVGKIVSREMLRANFYYKLTEALDPGRYYLVLSCAGKEVMRSGIILTPNSRRQKEA
ncbi:MAG: HTTM domain-containing protein, partial [Planctomycetes bacterium]|nr:HTTM domain-containing protein [Planctomycetota bacterium]